jgi:alkanesulfonate monooxygenase
MLRFHWSLSSAGDPLRGARSRAAQSGVPNLAAHADFCRLAESCGIESLLVAFGSHRPDPIALVGALGPATERVKFMIACRSGVCAPTYFAQQINTLSVLTGGRVCINVVAGHSPHEHLYYGDDLTHDERYARTDEFWSICHALWRGAGAGGVDFAGRYYRVTGARLNTPFLAPDRTAPEIYLGGNSPQAEELAARHASCLLCLPDTPERMAPRVAALRARGVEVGLLVSQIARPTRDEALQAAQALLESAGEGARDVHAEFFRRSDSVAFTTTGRRAAEEGSAWLTPTLWTGAVPYLGAPAIALVGAAGEVADAILEYQRIGVSQFLFMGWPDDQAMTFFSREVLPVVRRRESAALLPVGGGKES